MKIFYFLSVIYFFISGVSFGAYFKENSLTIKEYSTKLHYVLIIILFAPILLIADRIWEGLKSLYSLFQLQFFYQFFFTKRWDNIPHNTLNDISKRVLAYKNTNSLRDRIYRYCVYLVNKRNKYYTGFVNNKTGAEIKKPIINN